VFSVCVWFCAERIIAIWLGILGGWLVGHGFVWLGWLVAPGVPWSFCDCFYGSNLRSYLTLPCFWGVSFFEVFKRLTSFLFITLSEVDICLMEVVGMRITRRPGVCLDFVALGVQGRFREDSRTILPDLD
jgi:hypothetical protein